MLVISLKEVVECNALLKERELYFRIHIRDACGKQSCWIEPLSGCYCGEPQYEEMYQVLQEYFGKMRYELEYDEEKLNFWLKEQTS